MMLRTPALLILAASACTPSAPPSSAAAEKGAPPAGATETRAGGAGETNAPPTSVDVGCQNNKPYAPPVGVETVPVTLRVQIRLPSFRTTLGCVLLDGARLFTANVTTRLVNGESLIEQTVQIPRAAEHKVEFFVRAIPIRFPTYQCDIRSEHVFRVTGTNGGGGSIDALSYENEKEQHIERRPAIVWSDSSTIESIPAPNPVRSPAAPGTP
ncbi:hypothetical protein [Pendulispora albinea]|uniref:Lipoprotein n=1 Tax=Pendulispora albinea TaxID=2741071 RepID=A0ABZ2LRM4_9BACT